jgi:hypothetical protein
MNEPHRQYFAETVFGPVRTAYFTLGRSNQIQVHCEGYTSKTGKIGNVSPVFMARDILGSMRRAGKTVVE